MGSSLAGRAAGRVLLAGTMLLALAGSSLAVNEGQPMALGDTFESGISHVGDEDTCVFEGTSGARIWLSLMIPRRGELSPALELLDPAGVALSPKRKGSARRISIRGFELPETGLYAVRIAGSGDTEGAYVLKTRGKRPRKSRLKGIALGEDDVREFPFGVVAGSIVTVKIKARRGQEFEILEILDPEGSPIAGALDGVIDHGAAKILRLGLDVGFGDCILRVGGGDAGPSELKVSIGVKHPKALKVAHELTIPEPKVIGVEPTEAAHGATVEVLGEDFVAGALVLFDDLPGLDPIFNSPTSLGATLPPLGLPDGPVDVTVINPDLQKSTAEDALEIISDAFVIVTFSPTNGQEVQSDLSDAGLDGRIRVVFNRDADPGTLYDWTNPFNALALGVTILDKSYTRLTGVPVPGDSPASELWFNPAGGMIPNGQYLISFTSAVTDKEGTPLEVGLWDSSSSFTVGPDVYAPVVRGIYPVNAQSDVARDTSILVVFDESLDPTTLSPATLSVVVASEPGSPEVPTSLELVQDGFVVVATTDDLLGAGATFEVTVTSGLKDLAGNPASPFVFSFTTEP